MEETGIFEIREDCLLVHMPEEVDHHTTKSIRRLADHYLLDNRVQQIVFDFADTMFMDSSGIGVIIGRSRKMGYFGGEVYAEHLSGRILKIFKVSGLHTLIRTSVPKQQKEREGEKHNA